MAPYRGRDGAAEWLASVSARYREWHGERWWTEALDTRSSTTAS